MEKTLRPGVSAQRHSRFGGTVGGICTGAVALAQAGLLAGRRFTLHWENQPAFVERFAALSPSGRRFEIERDHGADFAALVSDMCRRKITLGAEPEQRNSLAARIGSRNPGLLTCIELMRTHLEEPLSMEELADLAGYSRRHIERMFVSILGLSPSWQYRGLRLDLGRNLMSTTDMPLIEVATACGFVSVAHFSKSFRARFGVAPTTFDRKVSAARRGARQRQDWLNLPRRCCAAAQTCCQLVG